MGFGSNPARCGVRPYCRIIERIVSREEHCGRLHR